MKRFVAAAVALLITLGCAAFAEAYQEQILFRKIPWGSSCDEIAKEIPLSDLRASRGHGTAELLLNGEGMDTDVGTEYVGRCTEDLPTVAGYTPNYMEFYFAAVPDENGYLPVDESGNIIADMQRTKLYAAYYAIQAGNSQKSQIDAYLDLTNKLTKLYGDADVTTDTETVWHGTEGTMVSLRKVYWSGYWTTDIVIAYGCTQGDEWLGTAQDAVDRVFAEDTEGL
ncbi:MAG: hypothetical protein E7317_00880 [Clostridiales bacterium]|nr:hypothetical protein [Clostridiales bacterium]